jgi:hypothetical protein
MMRIRCNAKRGDGVAIEDEGDKELDKNAKMSKHC